MSKPTLGIALAALLALSAGAAAAQSVTQPPRPAADMKGVTGAPGSLAGMIGAIERTTGGRVIEIRLTNADAMPGFHAVVARGGRVIFVRIAGQADAVELDGSSVPDWMLHWRDRTDVKLAEEAKVSLADAIRTAEQNAEGAPAVAAGIAPTASNPTSDVQAYNVLVDRHGAVQRVAVDDETGDVIANPRALAWP
jgi:uncharacterized membrane protein YkoI